MRNLVEIIVGQKRRKRWMRWMRWKRTPAERRLIEKFRGNCFLFSSVYLFCSSKCLDLSICLPFSLQFHDCHRKSTVILFRATCAHTKKRQKNETTKETTIDSFLCQISRFFRLKLIEFRRGTENSMTTNECAWRQPVAHNAKVRKSERTSERSSRECD